jgi:hypothetical protein
MNLKHEGQVVYFNDVKHYALIAEHIPVQGGGFRVEKYYVPIMRVIFQMSEKIAVGQYARFEISPAPPRNSGEYHTARNVEFFDTLDQLKFYAAALGPNK